MTLGVVYTASPRTNLVLPVFRPLVRCAARDSGASEGQAIGTILPVWFAARLLLIAALFVAGLPSHIDLSVGALAGDEAYNVSRSLRVRDVLLGMASSKYDFIISFDEYGRSSYLTFLTVVQTLMGPAPYGMKVFNAALFVVGGILLYRLVRASYGALPAAVGLGSTLFIPSVLYASTSALKESAYFLASAVCVVGTVQVCRASCLIRRMTAVVVVAGCVWVLSDLRRAGGELALAGLAVALTARATFVSKWRITVAAAAVSVAVMAVLIQPQLRERLMAGITSAAKLHSGHVFTVGHAYQLLDDGFYYTPAAPSSSPLTLTPDHATRFVLRGIYSFLVTPLPWEMRSRGELALLPEQMLWYLMLAGLPIGLVAGGRRDLLVTALLAGYVLPTAAVVAFTTGNVGTLVRLRGLVTPYLLWVSVLGYCFILERLAARRAVAEPQLPSFGAVTRATR